jgi:hypothetical protein
VQPEPWSALVGPDDAVSGRWYDPADVDAAVAGWRAAAEGS